MNMAVKPEFRGKLLQNEPMSRHCSWRAGGCVDLYYEPVDRQDLLAFIRTLTDETPITWLGLGSNLLVRDGGLRGVDQAFRLVAKLDGLPPLFVFFGVGFGVLDHGVDFAVGQTAGCLNANRLFFRRRGGARWRIPS